MEINASLTRNEEQQQHAAARRSLFVDALGTDISKSSPASPTNSSNGTGLKITKAVEFNAAVVGGCLLSINAGCINAITFLETGFTVSHLTGATTHTAVNLIEYDDFRNLYKYVGIIFSFTFGSMLTGLLGGNYDDFKLGHSYGRVLMCCFSFLVLALIDELIFPNSYSFIFLCAIACGMQNAMTTKFSGNMIRTTHVTGSFTDIGLTIGRILRGRKDLSWKLGLLCPMTMCFWFGSLLGAGLFPYLGRYTLIINIVVFGLAGILYVVYFARAFHEKSYLNIIMGRSEFTVLTEDEEDIKKSTFDFNQVENYTKKIQSLLRDRAGGNSVAVL
jgi:uncharacterized membrane protein YoaK (UPF0700 family)